MLVRRRLGRDHSQNQLSITLIQNRIMERPLFTKIIDHHLNPRAEQVARILVNHLIENSANKILQKKLKEKEVQVLTQQVMSTEINTVGQAYNPNPHRIPMVEDTTARNNAYEAKRPMSAKINYRTKTTIQERPTSSSKLRRSQYRPSRSSARSSNSKNASPSTQQVSKRYRFQKQNLEKFIPIPLEVDMDDSLIDHQYLAQMRAKKAKEAQFELSKKQFFQTIAQEQDRTSKLNKRFIQQMSNKTYYYNSKGQALQTPQASRLMKKSITTKTFQKVGSTRTFGQQPSSRRILAATDKNKESVLVQFKSKVNFIRNSLQPQVLDESQMLFFKSEHCKYKII